MRKNSKKQDLEEKSTQNRREVPPRPEYRTPEVLTYSSKELLEILGPARGHREL